MSHLHQLHTIKSQDDCSEFLAWLSENPEVTNVQGWYIIRNENSRVYQFSAQPDGYGSTYFWADVKNLWERRRTWNDWIRTYKNNFVDWSQYGQFATEAREHANR